VAAGGVEEDGRASVGRHLDQAVGEVRRVERSGGGPVARTLRILHRGQNSGVPLSRISWLVTVGICLIAALLLLLNGYYGYAGVLLAVGAAAAVNLL
jgi:hypothetical protein